MSGRSPCYFCQRSFQGIVFLCPWLHLAHPVQVHGRVIRLSASVMLKLWPFSRALWVRSICRQESSPGLLGLLAGNVLALRHLLVEWSNQPGATDPHRLEPVWSKWLLSQPVLKLPLLSSPAADSVTDLWNRIMGHCGKMFYSDLI